MKANEAPEKIYMNWVNYPLEEMQVEYTRTDAFIEKAVKWLEENASLFVALADEEHSAIGDTKATYGTKSLIYYFKQEFEV